MQRKCEAILKRRSRNIQSKVIKVVNIELYKLWQQRKLIKIKISETFSQEEQRRIRANIRRRIQIIEKNTKRRHQRKIERGKLCIENNFKKTSVTKEKRKKKKSETQSERKDKKSQRGGSGPNVRN